MSYYFDLMKIICCVLSINLLLISSSLSAEQGNSKNSDGEDLQSLHELVSRSDNAIVRRQALRKLANKAKALKNEKRQDKIADKSEKVEKIQKTILNALEDRNPRVVEESATLIGKLNITKAVSSLVSIYGEANQRFGGYGESVRLKIIKTCGTLRTPLSSKFLSDCLAKSNASIIASELLSAIQNQNDPSILKQVQAFQKKMDDIVALKQSNGADPMSYSMALQCAEKASVVAVALSNKGGK
jgi:hypothetical protein